MSTRRTHEGGNDRSRVERSGDRRHSGARGCEQAGRTDWAAYLLEPHAPEWRALRDHYPTCSDCAGELAAWSRVERGIREAAGEPHVHPEAGLLCRFLDAPESVADSERREIEEHLDRCASCRREIDAAAAFAAPTPQGKPPLHAEPGPLQRWLDAMRSAVTAASRHPGLAAAAAAALVVAALLLAAMPLRGPDAPAAALAAAKSPASVPAPPRGVEPQSAHPGAPRAPDPAPPRVARSAEASDAGGRQTVAEPRALAAVDRSHSGASAAADARPPAPAAADDPALALTEADELQLAAADPALLPRYLPPDDIGAGFGRFVGLLRTSTPAQTHPLPLVPEHMGRTVAESPRIHWMLLEPTAASVSFSLVDSVREASVIDFVVAGPQAAGIHSADLREHGVRLEVGVPYRWYVSVLRGERPGRGDAISGGGIERVAADPGLQAELRGAQPGDAALVYAANGLWYDALGALVDDPDASARSRRAALFEQVGLESAAAHERTASAAAPAELGGSR